MNAFDSVNFIVTNVSIIELIIIGGWPTPKNILESREIAREMMEIQCGKIKRLSRKNCRLQCANETCLNNEIRVN